MTPYQKLKVWSTGAGVTGGAIASYFGLQCGWSELIYWTAPFIFGFCIQAIHFSSLVECEPLIEKAGRSRDRICFSVAFWMILLTVLTVVYAPKGFSGLPSLFFLLCLLSFFPSLVCMSLSDGIKVSNYPGNKSRKADESVFGTRASHTAPPPPKPSFWRAFWRVPDFRKEEKPVVDVRDVELEISEKWRKQGIIK